jgi:RecB family endonuclease NucS
MNHDGELVIIELKRDKTCREVVAQWIDYATWVKNLIILKMKKEKNI